ncbi:Prenyltransferase and squalene oxidase repeat protein [Planctomycetes bacterium MalM25]|nr:Prenyltransferase and squalene oxidase repeat protein [Planctomycetes bacterium MalM25]
MTVDDNFEAADEGRRGSLGLGPIGRWFDSDPAWLASAILHLTLLILGALLVMGAAEDDTLSLSVGVAEDLGEQMIEESLDLTAATELEVPEQLITPELLPEVNDPLATPPEAPVTPTGIGMASDLAVVSPGVALSGRTPGMKQMLLKQMGATAQTEAAVLAGLKWLQKQQRKDGGWSLKGPYAQGSPNENREAATAMALLAFQGAGKLPTNSRDDFGRVVRRGWNWLLERQNEDGSFFHRGGSNHRFYTEALCTIALCELLAMTGDEQYRKPASKAVEYLISSQSELGGWKYYPGPQSDLSVTGWVLMALKSARMAGIEVPSPVFLKIEDYLDTVSRAESMSDIDRGSRYVYESSDIFNREAIPTMTAVGLLCRQYLGWPLDERRLESGVDFLLTHKPEWRRGKTNLYYWYYATQVLMHKGGASWPKWNLVMRELLPEHQEKKGPEKGSWDPRDDMPWGASGGRLYTTCFAIYTLEVYYRHLPLYKQRATH